ncbi:MAG: hypothetical protein ABGW77_05750 [Campylobacterales bacterium]
MNLQGLYFLLYPIQAGLLSGQLPPFSKEEKKKILYLIYVKREERRGGETRVMGNSKGFYPYFFGEKRKESRENLY